MPNLLKPKQNYKFYVKTQLKKIQNTQKKYYIKMCSHVKNLL